MRYAATTQSFHWYSDPWFGDTFVVERYKDRVLVNGRALPIAVVSSDTSWTARSADATFVASGTSWTFNGLAGQATGSLEKR